MTLLVSAITLLAALTPAFCAARIAAANRRHERRFGSGREVCLRKFPYPYKAALAICSDIDRTRSVEQFLKIQRFLNTKAATEMGPGVGLEIGNSFFMWPRLPAVFSYFSSRQADRQVIARLVEAGYLDVLHSWGEGCRHRRDAVEAVKELTDKKLKIPVWVNHATVKNNLGFSFPHFFQDQGDNRHTKHYHADVTIPYGIRFVWTGATTWVIGQATRLGFGTFAGSFDSQYPLKSTVNLLKALFKHTLAMFGLLRSRYAMHAFNELARPCVLDDGQKVYEFMRYDNHFNGIGEGASGDSMHYNLSPRVISRLKAVNGYAILYTHFGINAGCPSVICEQTQAALRRLEHEYRSGEVYVTTTSRLLTYYVTSRFLDWDYENDDGAIVIRIKRVADPVFGEYVPTEEDLQGITFYVPRGRTTRVLIGDREIRQARRNPADESNRESVTLPQTPLAFPQLDDLGFDLDAPASKRLGTMPVAAVG